MPCAALFSHLPRRRAHFGAAMAKAKPEAAKAGAEAAKAANAKSKAQSSVACPGEPRAKVAKTAKSPLLDQDMPETDAETGASAAAAPPGAACPTADASASALCVPSARPAVTSTDLSAWPRWQDPGDEIADSVDTKQTMRMCVPWLKGALPAAMNKMGCLVDGGVEAVSPLTIQEGSGLKNYKEMWTPANCKVSI